MKLFKSILLLVATSAIAAPPDFHKDVAPILREYCAGCHNDDDLEGEFSVETFRSLMKGGENGAGIVAGKAAGSHFWQQLTQQKKPHMPPRKEPQLTAAHLATLKAWIDGGAKPPAHDRSILATLNVPKVAAAHSAKPPVTALAMSRGGIRSTAFYGKVLVGKRAFTGHSGKVNALSFSSDENFLVAASGVVGLRGEAVLWNLKTGKRVRTFGEGHRDTLYGAEISPDDHVLATAGYDRLIQLWNVNTGQRIRTLEGHNGAVHGIAFSPDGTVLASAGGDSAVKLWNTKTGQRLDTLGQPTGEQFIVRFTPDSQFVIAAGADKQIRLWRWMSKTKPRINPLVRVRFAHEDEITDLVISPDGQRLATASADRIIKIWTLPNLTPAQTFAHQSDVVSALAFAPDGKSLIVGRMDGSTAQLQLNTGAIQTAVTQTQSHTTIAEASLVELTEQEPNNAPKTAMAIRLPAKISGVILDDPDLFRFRAKAGEQWVLEINAARSKSPLDSKVEVLDATGAPIERVRLQAVRKSWLTFRGKDSSTSGDFRVFKWREMTLNQFLYLNGEVVKLWHYPRGPDSGYLVYPGSGTRHTFFDTTPLAHPLGQFAYIVEPLAAGITPPANGLPTFPVYFENDDDSQRRLGKDSKLTFTAPQDGEFIARVSDVRGAQGKDHKYTLTIRPRRPNFSVSLSGIADVPKGSGREFSVRAVRMDHFNGPIRVDITDVPAGFRVTTPLTIEAGQTQAYGAVYHAPGKPGTPKPITPNPAIDKLTWKLFHGSWPKVPDWSALKPVKIGELKHGFFNIEPADREDNFGMQFEGQIKIPKDGSYEFILASDDGSLLFIDGKKIVDNDGLHGNVRKSGKVDLKAGIHAIRVSYLEAAGMEELYVGWKGPGFAETSLSFADAAPASFAKVTATARINGKDVIHPVNNLSGLKLIAQPKLQVQVLPASGKLAPGEPLELTIAPGETISARVVIERNGTKGRVSFGSHDSGRNLPHGIYVDNIGLSGLLIVEGQTEREFFITADKWVPEMTRRFHLRTGSEKGIVSQPILLHVKKR
ncbi:MAG: hypothetical protein H8E27_11685 [Verrucomicrobia subdivision 3 bacterium]|nr:hypothetical protein [Limisphaerales bacterium]